MIFFIIRIILGLVISFFLTFRAIQKFIDLAFKYKIFDSPDGGLKKQKEPVPYLGGLALFLGFIISLVFVAPLNSRILFLIVGSNILLLWGLIDDLSPMKPYQKIFGQVVAALCFIKSGFVWKESFMSQILNLIISFVWFLTIPNAFNLIDIMDGLCGFTSIFALFSFLIFAILTANFDLICFIIALVGAIIAFLIFNKKPAKIYLGDSGSMFLGSLISAMPFMISWSEYNNFGFIIPTFLLAVPFFELGFLIIIRTYNRIPFYLGSPHHFAIFLKNKNYTNFQIQVFVFFFSLYYLVVSIPFFLNKISLITYLMCCIFGIFSWIFFVFTKK